MTYTDLRKVSVVNRKARGTKIGYTLVTIQLDLFELTEAADALLAVWKKKNRKTVKYGHDFEYEDHLKQEKSDTGSAYLILTAAHQQGLDKGINELLK